MLTTVGRRLFCPKGIRKYAIKVANITKNPSSAQSFPVRSPKGEVNNRPAEKGSEYRSENRNIHFMNVTTLYFSIRGRNIPKYRAKLRVLATRRTTPSGFVSSAPVWPTDIELNIKNNTPPNDRTTPRAFFHVIGSLRNIAATNIVKIGVIEPRMEVSMAVVIGLASRKVSWGTKRPKNEAAAVRSRSLGAIFSLGVKIEMSQKSVHAPIARRVNITVGDNIPLLLRSLVVTMLMPNIAYAAKIER